MLAELLVPPVDELELVEVSALAVEEVSSEDEVVSSAALEEVPELVPESSLQLLSVDVSPS